MPRRTIKQQPAISLFRPEDFGIGTLFGRVPDAVVVREAASNRIVLWNQGAREVFGYPDAAIIGRTLDVVIPGGLPATWPASGFAQVAARHQDGSALVIELSSSPVTSTRHAGAYELALMRDVTGRVRAQQALQERLELLDASHEAIFVFDPAFRLTFWNHGAETMYGWPAAEALGRPIPALLQTRFPIPLEAIQAQLQARGAWEGELEHTRRDGRRLLVASRWIVRRDEAGAPVAILGTNNDITATKQLELALTASEARFKAFMDAGPVVAFIRDDAGRYVYVNRPHQEVFGSRDWVGTTVFDHFPADTARAIAASDRRVLESGQAGQFEEALPFQGKVLQLLAFKFPFTDLAGRRLVGSAALDVAPLKQAREEIERQAQALAAANRELQAADRYKDEFLAMLSHELRTPLNFIMGFASLMEEEATGPLQGYVHKVLYGADRLLAIVDNLLDMSRIITNTFQLSCSPTAYGAVVEGVVEAMRPVAAEKGVALRYELAVPAESLLDGERIRHVLLNLVDNAIKFTPPGGEVRVRAFTAADRLVTEVCDTGVGIAAADIPKLFKRFKQLDMSATREAGGMGLGLALAKAIVEGHGGTLAVTSVRGQGSTFRFELPERAAA